MRLLKRISQIQGQLKRCPPPEALRESKNCNTELEFELAKPALLSPRGRSTTFTGRICGVDRTRSNTMLVVGVIENGPEHTFMFSAECDPETMCGEIAFYNASHPELNGRENTGSFSRAA